MNRLRIIAALALALAALTTAARVPRVDNTFIPKPPVDISAEIDFGRDSVAVNSREVIVIHSSYYAGNDRSRFSRDGVIDQYRHYDVSPHYLITRDGTIYRMAPDSAVCYHAGAGALPDNGRDSLNSCSIGIEIINTKREGPTEEQYRSLAGLVDDLAAQYPITHIVGHSDIAPERKTDPWAFSWRRLERMLAPPTRRLLLNR